MAFQPRVVQNHCTLGSGRPPPLANPSGKIGQRQPPPLPQSFQQNPEPHQPYYGTSQQPPQLTRAFHQNFQRQDRLPLIPAVPPIIYCLIKWVVASPHRWLTPVARLDRDSHHSCLSPFSRTLNPINHNLLWNQSTAPTIDPSLPPEFSETGQATLNSSSPTNYRLCHH